MKRNKSLVGRIAAAALAVGVATCVPQTQANAAYLGEVGFYGAVPIVPGLTPRLWYANPVIAIGAAIGLAPLYLNVPALHRLNWLEYCNLYGACYSPVYFIHDDWYRYTYVPYFVRHYGRPGPGRGPGPGPAPAPGRPGGPGGSPATMSAGPQGGVPVPNQIRSNTAPATTSARSAGTPSTMSARSAGSASTPSTMSSRSAGSTGGRSGGASAPRPMGGGSMGGARGGGGMGGARGGGGGGRR